MYIRRYYKKGLKYPYTVGEEYKKKLIEDYGEMRADLIDNADEEVILEGSEEELEWFNDSCERVIANPGFYLANLDKLLTFRVKIQEIHPKFVKWKVETETFI